MASHSRLVPPAAVPQVDALPTKEELDPAALPAWIDGLVEDALRTSVQGFRGELLAAASGAGEDERVREELPG